MPSASSHVATRSLRVVSFPLTCSFLFPLSKRSSSWPKPPTVAFLRCGIKHRKSMYHPILKRKNTIYQKVFISFQSLLKLIVLTLTGTPRSLSHPARRRDRHSSRKARMGSLGAFVADRSSCWGDCRTFECSQPYFEQPSSNPIAELNTDGQAIDRPSADRPDSDRPSTDRPDSAHPNTVVEPAQFQPSFGILDGQRGARISPTLLPGPCWRHQGIRMEQHCETMVLIQRRAGQGQVEHTTCCRCRWEPDWAFCEHHQGLYVTECQANRRCRGSN